MSGDTRRREVERLFDAALDLGPDARSAWLEAACGDDAELLAEVQALLAAHGRAEGILERDPAAGTGPAPAIARHERIGPYRVVEEIGRGGMGVVFLAERADGQFRQRVAIKLILGGPDAFELHRRFEAERQILAALNHPNIARLLDGGITSGGRPYLAMEFIDGEPIDTYCDRHGLTVEQRLRLFGRVARAVHHAHRSLVVHRDLKPPNILVTADGVPKLLDFGIAKILDASGVGTTTPRTRTELRLMTPEYASPEQVAGEPVTTATDVYALGVVLYELLAGRRPFGFEGQRPREIERILLEEQPPAPSAALAHAADLGEVARLRGTTGDRLVRRLRGDLDRIALMALRKEPERRYASAEQLAEDLFRHLDGKPVLAHQDSLGYRTRKFVARHRVAIVAGMLLAASLLAGIAAASWQARRAAVQSRLAAAERDRAVQEAEKAQRVASLMADLFRLSDPNEALGDTVTARQVLDAGTARIETELRDQPALQADLLSQVAAIYANLGLRARAESLVRLALALRETHQGGDDLETAISMADLGRLLAQRGARDEAIGWLERAITVRERAPQPDSVQARARADLAFELRSAGRHDEAARLFAAALEARRALFGDASADVATTLLGLAAAHHDAGRFDEAETLFERVIEGLDTTGARPHPLAATALHNLAVLRRIRERPAEAERLNGAGLRIRAALYERDHPDVVVALNERAQVLLDLGRYAEAADVAADGLGRALRGLGPGHETTTELRGWLAEAEIQLGRYGTGLARYDTVLAERRRQYDGDHPGLVRVLIRAGDAHLEAGGHARAAAILREALAMNERTSGTRSVYRILALHGLAMVDLAENRTDASRVLLDEAVALADALLRPDHRYRLAVRRSRALLEARAGSAGTAAADLEDVLRLQRSRLPEPHPALGRTLAILGEAYLAAGDTAAAGRALREALDQLAGLPVRHPRQRGVRRLLERAGAAAPERPGTF
jgi:serine/threonine protein kinase